MATGKGTESTTNTQKRPGPSPDEGKEPPATSPDEEKKPPAMPVGPQQSVRVFKTFPGAEKATPEARCNVGNDAHFKDQSLGHLRKYLNSQKTLKSIDSGLPFCTPDGARVEESTKFSDYAKLVQETDNPGSTGQKGGTGGTTDNPEPAGGPHKTDELTTCNVYLLARKSEVELSDPVKNFLDSALDTSISENGELPRAVLKQLKSSYNHTLWRAGVGKDKTYPAEMSEDDWAIVMQNNDVLHGLRVIPARASDDELALNGIDRSFLPAFTLKPRPVEFYKRAPGVQLDTTAEYAVPRFRVQDDSYVRMTEAKSDVESSFASSSLTQHDAQAAVGGSAFGWDAGAKFGLTKKDEGKYTHASQESVEMMHISYNFPRVVLRLDENSLELDPVCRSRLDKVTDFSSMSAFFNDYGQFFATQVQLGGRLHAAEDVKATAGSTKEDKVNALKFAAGVSFSGPMAQGSVSYSRETKTATAQTEQKASYNKSMSWEAQGGDTLLCNSPPDWCPTVHSFHNWRTIKEENLVFLPDLIGKVTGCLDIPGRFKQIAEGWKPGIAGAKIVPYFVEFTLELEGSGGKEFALDTYAPGDSGANIVVVDEEAMSSNPATYFLPAVYGHWRKVKREMGGVAINFLSDSKYSFFEKDGVKDLFTRTWRFGGDPNAARRVTSRKTTQTAKRFKILTQNLEGNKFARRGQQYQIDIPGESMSLSATSSLPGYVPQSYLFARDFQTEFPTTDAAQSALMFHFSAPQIPVKFAFWDTELAEDEQIGIIPDGTVVNLAAWIPNSTKPGFVCLRNNGEDFDILPGSPDLNKIARFKIKYGKAYEAPLTKEEKRRAEEEEKKRRDEEEERKRHDDEEKRKSQAEEDEKARQAEEEKKRREEQEAQRHAAEKRRINSVQFKLQLLPEPEGHLRPKFLTLHPKWGVIFEVTDPDTANEDRQMFEITVDRQGDEMPMLSYDAQYSIHTCYWGKYLYKPVYDHTNGSNKKDLLSWTSKAPPKHLSTFGFKPISAKDQKKIMTHGDEVQVIFWKEAGKRETLKVGQHSEVSAAFANVHTWSVAHVKLVIV